MLRQFGPFTLTYHARMLFKRYGVAPVFLFNRVWKSIIVGFYVRFGWRYVSVSVRLRWPWTFPRIGGKTLRSLDAIEAERSRLAGISRSREATIGALMFVLVIGGLCAEFLLAAYAHGWRP